MTAVHYIVFIGASAALANELAVIRKRIDNVQIVAPAIRKGAIGATNQAVDLALTNLFKSLETTDNPNETARLTLWMYEPPSADQFKQVLKAFGHSAWLETVPQSYVNKVGPTREYIEKRVNGIRPLLHQVASATYAQRKSSPLTLPLRNFRSEITTELKSYWYNRLNAEEISKKISSLKMRYSQTRDRTAEGFKDERALVFKPASDGECHGRAHPLGAEQKSYICGRFRYGVALFPGFHYDVSSGTSAKLRCDLITSSGGRRKIGSEKKSYMNIFPNDHLLPEK